MYTDEAPRPAQRSVLIIEDSDTIRSFLRRIFEREMPELGLIEATDGKAALHEMTKNRADLIVTDLQMPGMDGRSFIAKIRSNPLLRKKGVVVLSSDNLSDLRQLYSNDSGVRFLSKPSSSEQILAVVRELFAAMNAAPTF